MVFEILVVVLLSLILLALVGILSTSIGMPDIGFFIWLAFVIIGFLIYCAAIIMLLFYVGWFVFGFFNVI